MCVTLIEYSVRHDDITGHDYNAFLSMRAESGMSFVKLDMQDGGTSICMASSMKSRQTTHFLNQVEFPQRRCCSPVLRRSLIPGWSLWMEPIFTYGLTYMDCFFPNDHIICTDTILLLDTL